MAKKYEISDGALVLTLEAANGGGYAVTSTMDPALSTRAASVEEAFTNARNALRILGGPAYDLRQHAAVSWNGFLPDAEGQRYLVSDGRMVLELIAAEQGGYCVSGVMEPGLITQAETIEESFFMARDALKGLRIVRRQLSQERSRRPKGASRAGAAA